MALPTNVYSPAVANSLRRRIDAADAGGYGSIASRKDPTNYGSIASRNFPGLVDALGQPQQPRGGLYRNQPAQQQAQAQPRSNIDFSGLMQMMMRQQNPYQDTYNDIGMDSGEA